MRMSLATQEKALTEYQQLKEPVTWYRSLWYKTLDSWSRFRRVVAKVAYGPEGCNIRFVVTSLSAGLVSPSRLYTQQYCPRGEMENRFKEQQLELFSDRTSTHTFQGNQLRLWFSSLAYVLMQSLRQSCLTTTELADAQVGTIRTKLLKLGARVLISVRRIQIATTHGLSLPSGLCHRLQQTSSLAQYELSPPASAPTHSIPLPYWSTGRD